VNAKVKLSPGGICASNNTSSPAMAGRSTTTALDAPPALRLTSGRKTRCSAPLRRVWSDWVAFTQVIGAPTVVV
jgi:hypothetical protein